MKSEIALSLSTVQKLTLTPELRQSIQILQLSNYELSQYIQEQVTDNPMLDIEWTTPVPLNKKTATNRSLSDSMTNIQDPGETLQEHCVGQLSFVKLDSICMRAALYLVGNLNDDGYLAISINEAHNDLAIPMLEIEKALRIVQSLEPIGVGARNLKECLLVQINSRADIPVYSREVVQNHLHSLAAGKFSFIAKTFNVHLQDVERINKFIHTLNPRPGLQIGYAGYGCVIPDASIKKTGDRCKVQMKESTLPRLSMNDVYLRLLQEPNQEDHKQFLMEKWKSGNSLIKSIEQRRQTLYRVITAILEEQPQFIDKGMHNLRPLNLRTIAEKLHFHESTISRAIHNKFVDTPHGILGLRDFFSTGLHQEAGDTTSAVEMKERIKQLIANENKKKPLSDAQIVKEISEQGLQISRRTVNKYREEMRILSSMYRKNS